MSNSEQGLNMNITIGKQHEGSIIYGLGTGNNKPRSGPNDPKKFDVIKVNQKYVKLATESWGFEDNYHPKSGATQTEINRGFSSNAGYKFFESLEDIDSYQEHRKKYSKVMDYFNHGGGLSKTQADQIHEILFNT